MQVDTWEDTDDKGHNPDKEVVVHCQILCYLPLWCVIIITHHTQEVPMHTGEVAVLRGRGDVVKHFGIKVSIYINTFDRKLEWQSGQLDVRLLSQTVFRTILRPAVSDQQCLQNVILRTSMCGNSSKRELTSMNEIFRSIQWSNKAYTQIRP